MNPIKVSDIPRLYRRTNKELPAKPCAYMNAVLSPLDAFFREQKPLLDEDRGKEGLHEWLLKIFESITGIVLGQLQFIKACYSINFGIFIMQRNRFISGNLNSRFLNLRNWPNTSQELTWRT